MPIRNPLNAPGDFYVERGQCISCGAPEGEAPMLMAFDEEEGCYFRRQPETEEEVQCAIMAISVSCVAPHRYAGTDSKIRLRLAAMQVADACDHPLEQPVAPQSHVRFSLLHIVDATELAALFVPASQPIPIDDPYVTYRVVGDKQRAQVEVKRRGFSPQPSSHIVRLDDCDGAPTWLFHHHQHRHLLAFEATLQRLGAFDVTWFTAHEWANGEKGQSTLY
jgi:hypothetical protein